jgi:hypothetical protein
MDLYTVIRVMGKSTISFQGVWCGEVLLLLHVFLGLVHNGRGVPQAFPVWDDVSYRTSAKTHVFTRSRILFIADGGRNRETLNFKDKLSAALLRFVVERNLLAPVPFPLEINTKNYTHPRGP